jgi:hypothetical protein
MKKALLILVILIYSQIYSQRSDYVFEKLPLSTTDLHQLYKENIIPHVYIADISEISTLVKNSKKKYKVVYFFSPTCHSSKDAFPEFVKYFMKNDTLFDFFPVSGLRYDKIQSITNYLKSVKYYNPIFIIDTEKHGNKSEPFKRLDLLSVAMCPDCIHKEMGFSSYFILDSNNKVILHTNWNYIGVEKFEALKKLPLTK